MDRTKFKGQKLKKTKLKHSTKIWQLPPPLQPKPQDDSTRILNFDTESTLAILSENEIREKNQMHP